MPNRHSHLTGFLAATLLMISAALIALPDAHAATKHKPDQGQETPGQIGQMQTQSQQNQPQSKGSHAAGMLTVTIVRREGHRAGSVLVRVHHVGGRFVASRHMNAGSMSVNGPVGRYTVTALHRGGRQVRHTRVVSGRSSHVTITISEHVRRHHHRHERFLLGLHHRHHHNHQGQKQTPQSKSTATFNPTNASPPPTVGQNAQHPVGHP